MSEITDAVAHFKRFHRRTRHRNSGSVLRLAEADRAEQRHRELQQAEASLGEALVGLDAAQRRSVIEAVASARRQAVQEANLWMLEQLPMQREPLLHGAEGCGMPSARERAVLAAGRLVRVRSDACSDPGCPFGQLPPARHEHLHQQELIAKHPL